MHPLDADSSRHPLSFGGYGSAPEGFPPPGSGLWKEGRNVEILTRERSYLTMYVCVRKKNKPDCFGSRRMKFGL